MIYTSLLYMEIQVQVHLQPWRECCLSLSLPNVADDVGMKTEGDTGWKIQEDAASSYWKRWNIKVTKLVTVLDERTSGKAMASWRQLHFLQHWQPWKNNEPANRLAPWNSTSDKEKNLGSLISASNRCSPWADCKTAVSFQWVLNCSRSWGKVSFAQAILIQCSSKHWICPLPLLITPGNYLLTAFWRLKTFTTEISSHWVILLSLRKEDLCMFKNFKTFFSLWNKQQRGE